MALFTSPICYTFVDGEPPTKKMTTLRDVSISKLKTRYCRQLPTTRNIWITKPISQYVCLALVHKDTVTLQDQNLVETTKLIAEGKIDQMLEKKKSLEELAEIFCYENERVILITGAPGEY